MTKITWIEAFNWARSKLDKTDCLRLMTDGSELKLLDVYKKESEPYEDFYNLKIKVSRRLKGEPIAYITGVEDFWKYSFSVNKHVLIPRQDSEIVIETLEQLKPNKILELGVGSGALIISYLLDNPNTQGYASDISEEAVKIAKLNANRLGCKNLILKKGSWFEPWQGKFPVIISNPPYLSEHDQHLTELKFEPQIALTSPNNGLKDLFKIIEQAPQFLEKNGYLLLEHGYQQALDVQNQLNNFKWRNIRTIKDINNKDRVTLAQVPLNE